MGGGLESLAPTRSWTLARHQSEDLSASVQMASQPGICYTGAVYSGGLLMFGFDAG